MNLAQRRDAAAKIWQRLAEIRKEDPVITAQIADRMREIRRSDDAIELYQRAIDLAPDQPQYREYLGEYLHQLDRKEEAIAVWTSMAEDDQRSPETLIRLAEVLTAFRFPRSSARCFCVGRAIRSHIRPARTVCHPAVACREIR